jgi:hypothetical protein
LGLAAFGAVFAFAAGFDVTSEGVGGGSATVASCVPSGGSVHTDFVIENTGPTITDVTVQVLDDQDDPSTACTGKVVHLSLYNGVTAITGANGEATISGSTATVTLGTPAGPDDVTSVKLAISKS